MALSRKAFMNLKRGDIVLFNGKPRVVQQGPSDYDGKYVTFSIRRRSWTGRAYTVYLHTDIKKICSLPRKKFNLIAMCNAEKEHLASIGFDWIKELRRELSEDRRHHNTENRAWKLAKRQLARADH